MIHPVPLRLQLLNLPFDHPKLSRPKLGPEDIPIGGIGYHLSHLPIRVGIIGDRDLHLSPWFMHGTLR